MKLKIDLEKAYDIMEWDFVDDTLKDAALSSNIVDVVMRMIWRSSSRLLWNGELQKL